MVLTPPYAHSLRRHSVSDALFWYLSHVFFGIVFLLCIYYLDLLFHPASTRCRQTATQKSCVS